MTREYTPTQRAEAVALALALGDKKAAVQTGIPRRTISYWRAQPASSPIVEKAERDIAETLRSVTGEALDKVRQKIHDPKTTVGELAQLIRVTSEQTALLEGRATSNIETHSYSMTPNRGKLDHLPDEEAELLDKIVGTLMFSDDDELLAAIHDGTVKARDVTMG